MHKRGEWVLPHKFSSFLRTIRNNLGEETKTDAVRLLGDIFAEGGEVDAAMAAAAHLPPDLNFHNKEGS